MLIKLPHFTVDASATDCYSEPGVRQGQNDAPPVEPAPAREQHVVGERALHVGHHDGVYSGEPEVELDRRAMRQSDGADIRNMEGGQVDGGGPVVMRDRQFAQANTVSSRKRIPSVRASEYRQFAQANTKLFSFRIARVAPIENSLDTRVPGWDTIGPGGCPRPFAPVAQHGRVSDVQGERILGQVLMSFRHHSGRAGSL